MNTSRAPDIAIKVESLSKCYQIYEQPHDRLKQSIYPDMRGWSSSNLKYMRFFAQHCPDGQFGQQAADQLPWFHIVALLTRLDSPADREWYATQAVRQGWSRTTLELNIKNRLHGRQRAAVTNRHDQAA